MLITLILLLQLIELLSSVIPNKNLRITFFEAHEELLGLGHDDRHHFSVKIKLVVELLSCFIEAPNTENIFLAD